MASFAAGAALLVWPASPARAAAPVFDPVPGAASFADGVYGTVIADGLGAHHSVMRQDGLQQQIVYRRSADGGRTWLESARWSGEAGGATQPVLAVDGKHIAVAFLGGFCSSPGVCGQAAYAMDSYDGGLSFAALVGDGSVSRVANTALSVSVGVDGDRTWVAWEGRDAANASRVEIVGVNASGEFRRSALPGYRPQVAVGGGGGVVSFTREEIVDGARRLTPAAQLITGTTWGPRVDLDSAPVGLAAAAGRAHLLMRSGGQLSVRTAVVEGAGSSSGFGAAVPALRGEGGSIAARRGLVAVSAVDPASGVTSVARSRDGAAFGPPTAVARTAGAPYDTSVSVASLPGEDPVPVASWSVQPRYTDRDGDGAPDPANAGQAPGLSMSVPSMPVRLDGCASVNGPGAAITRWEWTVDGDVVPGQTCAVTVDLPTGVAQAVRLRVVDAQGRSADRNLTVTPRDLLVVSLGDSVASGEGNPHVAASPSDPQSDQWEDGPCHRSHFAGPALAARQLEEADPHSSVTFLQLACSGAAIVDVPAAGQPIGAADDPDTGGLLDRYHGVEPAGAPAGPSQLDELGALMGARTPDSVMVSIGANDVAFSSVVKACLAGDCVTDGTQAVLDGRLADLPRRYAALAAGFDRLGIPPSSVVLSEYFDIGSGSLGLADLRCVASEEQAGLLAPLVAQFPWTGSLYRGLVEEILDGEGIVSDDEARWAGEYVVPALNARVRDAASTHGWRAVGGLADAFQRHGYCAAESWVVGLQLSLVTQHDPSGAFHPNRAGHEEYGRRLGLALFERHVLEQAGLDSPLASTLGDVYVSTSGYSEATVAAALDEGDRLAPVGQRRLDRVVSGDAMVGHAGRPAADAASAIAGWYQLPGPAIQSWRTLIAPISLVRNVGVTSISVVQAAEGASRLVAGRPAQVMTRFSSQLDTDTTVKVTTVVTDDTGASVVDVTEDVRVSPGRMAVGLPLGSGEYPASDAAFVPEAGRSYVAQVTVEDPVGAPSSAEADNTASADTTSWPAAQPTRGLDVLAVPMVTDSDGGLACGSLPFALWGKAHRANAALAVGGQVSVDLGCANAFGDVPSTPAGVTRALNELEEVARLTGRDSVVAVAPDEWLVGVQSANGIAYLPGRALIVNERAPIATFGHELSHNLGVEHTTRAATGLEFGRDVQGRVTTATSYRETATHYMASAAADRWVSGPLWDTVYDRLRGSQPAQQPTATAPDLWLGGGVDIAADGAWSAWTGRWLPAEGPEDAAIGPDSERLTVRQLGSEGAVLDEQPVSTVEVGGDYLPGAGEEDPTTLAFSTRITVQPGARAIQLLLDGAVVEQRPVNAAPLATVVSPGAGAGSARGSQLEVAWTASDPDGDALTADLLVSDDNGASWRPLLLGATGASATVTVPADLDGDQVRIRVAVSDGVRWAFADSAAFSVGGPVTVESERVAFTRETRRSDGLFFGRLRTMDPDGLNGAAVAVPDLSSWNSVTVPDGDGGFEVRGYRCQYPLPDRTCWADHQDPTWSADGTRLYFSSDLVDTRFGGAADVDVTDRITWHLWSSDADGGDLRRVTQPRTTAPASGVPLGYSVRNFCADSGPSGISWLGAGVPPGFDPGALPSQAEVVWTADSTGASQRAVFMGFADYEGDRRDLWPDRLGTGWTTTNTGLAVLLRGADNDWRNQSLNARSCPKVSPDGTAVAFIAFVEEVPYTVVDGYAITTAAVVLVNRDGTNPRIVTEKLAYYASVDWIDSDTLAVTRRTGGCNGCPGTAWEFQPLALDLKTLTTSPLAPVRNYSQGPAGTQVAPNGDLYGTRTTTVTEGAQSRVELDLSVIDPSGAVRTVAVPDTLDTKFAWARSRTTTGEEGDHVVLAPPASAPQADAGGPYAATVGRPVVLSAGGSAIDGRALVEWDLDGDGAFDDADGPTPEVVFDTPGDRQVRVRVTPSDVPATVSEPALVRVAEAPPLEFTPAPWASGESQPPPPAVPLRIEVPAGVPTAVRLGPAEAPPVSYAVVAVDTDLVAVISGDGAGGGPGLAHSGAAGEIQVTPARDFRGSARLLYAPLGDLTATAELELVVVGNRAPTAASDTLTVDLGVLAAIPASDLLANDADPDGPGPLAGFAAARLSAAAPSGLRLVQVSGMTAGQAWLNPEGDTVFVLATRAGPATFTYAVADDGDAVGHGTVGVTVRAAASPTPTPTTTPTPTPTAGPTATPSPAVQGTSAAIPPSVASTGARVGGALWAGLLLVGLGAALVAGGRRRPGRTGRSG